MCGYTAVGIHMVSCIIFNFYGVFYDFKLFCVLSCIVSCGYTAVCVYLVSCVLFNICGLFSMHMVCFACINCFVYCFVYCCGRKLLCVYIQYHVLCWMYILCVYKLFHVVFCMYMDYLVFLNCFMHCLVYCCTRTQHRLLTSSGHIYVPAILGVLQV